MRGIDRPVLRGVSLHRRQGRVVRSRRRVGLRQDDRRLRRRCATCPGTAASPRGSIRVDGRDLWRDERGARSAQLRSSAVSMVYQNPGSCAEPVDPRRRPGRRGVHDRRARTDEDAERAREVHARQGADRGPGAGHAPLPAPALGRDAAARRDRDGARLRPDAAHPRRADDRARRDRRGRGARPRRRPAGGVRHERPVHQPQPRRDREDVRARRRPLRGPSGRGG